MKKKSSKNKVTNKPGRQSSFKEEYSEQAYKLCLLKDFTDDELAKFFGVAVRTLQYWKKGHPEFKAAIERGKAIADSEVALSLYQRAIGYEHDDVHITNYLGKIIKTKIKKHYPPDPTSMIFWLKNRQRFDWRDKIDHSLTGANDGPIDYNFEIKFVSKAEKEKEREDASENKRNNIWEK
jgi:transcriptional regulator with XRE-family HTH domain